MGKRLTNRQTFNQTNLQDVPDQSGIYLIRDRKGNCRQYIGSAGAGRLAQRLKEHLNSRDIPGAHAFQIRTTTSENEARKLEAEVWRVTLVAFMRWAPFSPIQ